MRKFKLSNSHFAIRISHFLDSLAYVEEIEQKPARECQRTDNGDHQRQFVPAPDVGVDVESAKHRYQQPVLKE